MAEHLTASSSDSLRSQRALRFNRSSVSVGVYRLGLKIELCDWKIEHMTLQAPTEEVEKSLIASQMPGLQCLSPVFQTPTSEYRLI